MTATAWQHEKKEKAEHGEGAAKTTMKTRSNGAPESVRRTQGTPPISGTLLCAILCAAMLVLCSRVAHASEFDAIKQTYSSINTLDARFHQKIFIAALKKEREMKGEFLYKRQKGFLWQYTEPKEKYFLYDGRYIYQGEDGKPFITKDRINKEKTGGTFLDLVEDIAKMDELFDLKGRSKAGDLEVLELKPKRDSTVTMARIWIDKQNMARKIEIQEFTGNINTIEFSGAKVNGRIDEGRLTFRPEKNKEVIER
jgi:outer membrane lipoprotein-sorting protein